MSRANKTPQKSKKITAELLRSWPLPQPGGQSDKEVRGALTVIAGAEGMPGAAILAAIAALRAGAGKLQIATPKCIAAAVAQNIPESMVVALTEDRAGLLSLKAGKQLLKCTEHSSAILIGCGMSGAGAGSARIRTALKHLLSHTEAKTVVIDACAVTSLKDRAHLTRKSHHRIIITPHAGEMAKLTGFEKSYIQENQKLVAENIARKFGVTVVMKGSETIIASSTGPVYHNKNGNPGLGTSGSGDVLAGIITGLAARGADPLQAAVWGVHLHALAGESLARSIGPMGYLASELSREIPALMAKLQ